MYTPPEIRKLGTMYGFILVNLETVESVWLNNKQAEVMKRNERNILVIILGF
jgi:hypothetical protein